jgi:hypothetical protein
VKEKQKFEKNVVCRAGENRIKGLNPAFYIFAAHDEGSALRRQCASAPLNGAFGRA